MKRKEILPAWIRFFSWFYLVFYLAPVMFIFGLFTPVTIDIYGWKFIGSSLHPFAIGTFLLMLFFAITAHFILWGKNLAIVFGIACGFIGLALSLSAMIYGMIQGGIVFRLEPLVQIPFIVVLFSKKREWDAFHEMTVED